MFYDNEETKLPGQSLHVHRANDCQPRLFTLIRSRQIASHYKLRGSIESEVVICTMQLASMDLLGSDRITNIIILVIRQLV